MIILRIIIFGAHGRASHRSRWSSWPACFLCGRHPGACTATCISATASAIVSAALAMAVLASTVIAFHIVTSVGACHELSVALSPPVCLLRQNPGFFLSHRIGHPCLCAGLDWQYPLEFIYPDTLHGDSALTGVQAVRLSIAEAFQGLSIARSTW